MKKQFLLLPIFIIAILSISTPNVYTTNNDIGELKTEIINLKAEVKILKNYVQEMDKRLTSQIQEMDKRLTSQIQEMDKRLTSQIQESDKKLGFQIEVIKWLLVLLIGIGLFPLLSKSKETKESKRETSRLENLEMQVRKIIDVLTKDGKIL